METKISEIADGIYRLSTYVPDIAPPAGFTFNQFLVLGDEPLMFIPVFEKCFLPIATHWAASYRPSACVGSRSGISRPTSAAR